LTHVRSGRHYIPEKECDWLGWSWQIISDNEYYVYFHFWRPQPRIFHQKMARPVLERVRAQGKKDPENSLSASASTTAGGFAAAAATAGTATTAAARSFATAAAAVTSAAARSFASAAAAVTATSAPTTAGRGFRPRRTVCPADAAIRALAHDRRCNLQRFLPARSRAKPLFRSRCRLPFVPLEGWALDRGPKIV
jgi:hypothetical protein